MGGEESDNDMPDLIPVDVVVQDGWCYKDAEEALPDLEPEIIYSREEDSSDDKMPDLIDLID